MHCNKRTVHLVALAAGLLCWRLAGALCLLRQALRLLWRHAMIG